MLIIISYCLICAIVSFVTGYLFAVVKKSWLLFIPSLFSLILGGYLFFLSQFQRIQEDYLSVNYYSHPFSEPSVNTNFILLLLTPLIICTLIWTIILYKLQVKRHTKEKNTK
ncbi:hypothetical protein [Peribacillus frigoritolerans]|uniref:hypothetical protein n=1 Tax=Peribacillus frigoritolerans TaxID=450367 RepID=UPI0020C05220|nr:hypothetical protein [Peribacillus frigoritolerans]